MFVLCVRDMYIQLCRHAPEHTHIHIRMQNAHVCGGLEHHGNPDVPFCFFSFDLSSVQFNSHLFVSPIGARTLKMPVPYSPPSVGAYTRTPSHQPLVFGRKCTDHLP